MGTNPQTQPIQQLFDPLDTPAKQLLRQKIDDVLTPEVQYQCQGLTILVLSLDEYKIMTNALKEASEKKRQQMRQRKQKGLTLNIVGDSS